MRTKRNSPGLHKLCNSIPEKHRNLLVEIGSFYGESTAIFAGHFKQVIAIDPWDFKGCNELNKGSKNSSEKLITGKMAEERFDENVGKIENIKKIKAYDHDVVDSFEDNSIDCIYIDSIHTFEACGLTILRWWPKVKNYGYIAGHDFTPMWPGIQKVVKIIAQMTKQRMRRFKGDCSWLLQKRVFTPHQV